MLLTIDERMAAVEARMTAQEANMVRTNQVIREGDLDLRGAMQAMDERIERRFDAVDRRFDAMDRRFQWMLAVQITTLLTVIGAVFSLVR
jgi:uncharacterized coiled-coil protein SlyX